jgi:hypothetical protein
MFKTLFKYSVPLVLTAAGTFFLIRSCSSYASEFTYNSKEAYWSWAQMREINENDLRKDWQESYEFHHFHAVRTFEDAKEKCWYLPRSSDREKARYCFTSVMSTIGASTKKGKLLNALITMLIHYGLDVMDEWDYINDKLYWCQYHYEMCEHYQILLQNS